MKRIDLFNGEWIKVTGEYLKGVADLENVEDVVESGNVTIRVNYKNGDSVYCQNVHGTWGFPTVIK